MGVRPFGRLLAVGVEVIIGGPVVGAGVTGVAENSVGGKLLRSGVTGRAIEGTGGEGFAGVELRATDDALEGRRARPARSDGGIGG